MIAQPAVIGHRGAAAISLDKTLASLKAPGAADAGWVASGVRLSDGGAPLVIHDQALERTTRLDKRIDEMAGAAIRDPGPVETLPSLAAVLDWLADLRRRDQSAMAAPAAWRGGFSIRSAHHRIGRGPRRQPFLRVNPLRAQRDTRKPSGVLAGYRGVARRLNRVPVCAGSAAALKGIRHGDHGQSGRNLGAAVTGQISGSTAGGLVVCHSVNI